MVTVRELANWLGNLPLELGSKSINRNVAIFANDFYNRRKDLFRILSTLKNWANSERLFDWWWWRSPNRPHIIDNSYISLLDQLPSESLGLDLGSRSRIRPKAITVDISPGPGVDIVADAHELPFPNASFDYIWCNAVLEHVPYPMKVGSEITRILKASGLAFIQVPFLENVHGWPQDYYRFTPQGLRVIFGELEEVKSGVSAGPSQVLPDLIQYYFVFFSELQKGKLVTNLFCLLPGVLLLPVRLLDHFLKNRPTYWKWARAYYWVGRKRAVGNDSHYQVGGP